MTVFRSSKVRGHDDETAHRLDRLLTSSFPADTLIVWTDDGVDMALSFQEAEGCALIWFVSDPRDAVAIRVTSNPHGTQEIYRQCAAQLPTGPRCER